MPPRGGGYALDSRGACAWAFYGHQGCNRSSKGPKGIIAQNAPFADPPDHTNATVFGADGSTRQLASPADISDVLVAEPDSFVWYDVVAADVRDFALIREEFDLHPLAIEDALHSHQRPKIEAYGDTWFVV